MAGIPGAGSYQFEINGGDVEQINGVPPCFFKSDEIGYSGVMPTVPPSQEDPVNNTDANRLCSACGLCCNGRLFIWVKLRPAEFAPAASMGLRTFQDHPTQRGFHQPCPLWQGICAIYGSPNYPHSCRSYKCKLLKQLINQDVDLPAALAVIQGLIGQVEALERQLPPSDSANFRERLVALLEGTAPPPDLAALGEDLTVMAHDLLSAYEDILGVTGLLEG